MANTFINSSQQFKINTYLTNYARAKLMRQMLIDTTA
jgi:hypothetical protein